MYVAIEGIDTSGKSTQIQALQSEFKEAIFTKEPGGTQIGMALRDILLHEPLSKQAELFLFLADRAEHFDKVIKPNMNSLIISDRSLISGMAYANDIDFEFLKQANAIATDHLMPDLVILLEIDEETLYKRLKQKEQDRLEARGVSYLLDIQERLSYITQTLNIAFKKIPATLDAHKITQEIIAAIKAKIMDL